VQPAAEAVAGDDEGLGARPHGEHDEERERPHGQQEDLHAEGRGREGPQHEGHVQRLHHVHHVSQEHEVRHFVHPCERYGRSVGGAALQTVAFLFPTRDDHLEGRRTGWRRRPLMERLGCGALASGCIPT
jgi:hypothetical protein